MQTIDQFIISQSKTKTKRKCLYNGIEKRISTWSHVLFWKNSINHFKYFHKNRCQHFLFLSVCLYSHWWFTNQLAHHAKSQIFINLYVICYNIDVDFAETGCASSSSSFFKMKPIRRNTIGCMGGTNKGLD